jgi:TatA/E family protein of Tat protein translocase
VFTGLESPTHLIIVLVSVLLLFGAKRVPELAKGLGRGYASSARGRGAKARRNWTRPPTTARSVNPANSFLRRTYSPKPRRRGILRSSPTGIMLYSRKRWSCLGMAPFGKQAGKEAAL